MLSSSLSDAFSQGLRILPQAIRKPHLLYSWLLGARTAQIVLALTLFLVPLVLKPTAKAFIDWLFPPVNKERLFGLLQTSEEDPRTESFKKWTGRLLWSGSLGLVAFLLVARLPEAMRQAEGRSRRMERDADDLGVSNPEARLGLYRNALALSLDGERIAALTRKMENASGRVPSPGGPGRSGSQATLLLKPDNAGQGKVIESRYQITREMGHGTMGVVYLAHDTILERDVAIKELPPSMTADPSSVERFRHEAKALARLAHPGIVHVYDFIENDKRAWIVMEFVEGGDMAGVMADRKRMSSSEAARYGSKLAEALAYAHGRGIVHRDFKPSNVLMTKDGSPKITDFGLAKLVNSSLQTVAGTILGSPAYMSPEQADGKAADKRSDIYSLGVVLYQMLAGKAPFEGEDLHSVLLQHLTKEPPPLADLVPDVPEDIEKLVMAMLRKDPGERPQEASAVAETLRLHIVDVPAPNGIIDNS